MSDNKTHTPAYTILKGDDAKRFIQRKCENDEALRMMADNGKIKEVNYKEK